MLGISTSGKLPHANSGLTVAKSKSEGRASKTEQTSSSTGQETAPLLARTSIAPGFPLQNEFQQPLSLGALAPTNEAVLNELAPASLDIAQDGSRWVKQEGNAVSNSAPAYDAPYGLRMDEAASSVAVLRADTRQDEVTTVGNTTTALRGDYLHPYNNLRKLREKSPGSLTMRQVAGSLRLTFSTISRIERQDLGLLEKYVTPLCELLNCTREQLLEKGAEPSFRKKGTPNNIRNLRIAADLSRLKLAEELSFHPDRLRRLEEHKQPLIASEITALCTALGCTRDQLLASTKRSASSSSDGAKEKNKRPAKRAKKTSNVDQSRTSQAAEKNIAQDLCRWIQEGDVSNSVPEHNALYVPLMPGSTSSNDSSAYEELSAILLPDPSIPAVPAGKQLQQGPELRNLTIADKLLLANLAWKLRYEDNYHQADALKEFREHTESPDISDEDIHDLLLSRIYSI